MRDTLKLFTTASLLDASQHLLNKLGLQYTKGAGQSFPAASLFEDVKLPIVAQEALAIVSETYFVGTIDERTFESNPGQIDLDDALHNAEDEKYNGIFVFALDLQPQANATRTMLSALSRAFNRKAADKPVVLFIRQESRLSLSTCERTKYKIKGKPGEKIGRVSLLKDVDCMNAHEGHVRIINDLDCSGINSFDGLYKKWQKVFNTVVLTKRFYEELFAWFQWAVEETSNVTFPGDANYPEDGRRNIEERVISLITRLLFVWFIKQKGLVPECIFKVDSLKKILRHFDEKSETQSEYYQAILQNLFFATLNRPIIEDGERRDFAKSTSKDSTNLYRYAELFEISETEVIDLFSNVPFLNCGLFECQDKTKTLNGVKRRFYNDGFSRNDAKFDNGQYKYRAVVPNKLFFDEERGILSVFERYVFTIEENTPQDVQVALDPELLGKVFENLLGYINPETHDTARNESGSFYTPREIVQFMVNESLVEHLKQTVAPELENEYRQLLDYTTEEVKLTTEQRSDILRSLFTCKVLDPACGSGAFPMGMLQQMVHILQQVDPDNTQWREVLRNMAADESRRAFGIVDEEERKKKLLEIEETFNNGLNSPDYTRKLYIIESCIYGVDKMPIAMLITRLRFFITLICEQNEIDWDSPERNFGIKTLPNLESKFVAANSLVSADIHKYNEDWTQDEVLGLLKDELMAIRRRHFYTSKRNEKIKLLRQDEEMCKKIRQYIYQLVKEPNEKKIKELQNQITYYENLLQNYQGECWVEEHVQTELFKESEAIRYDRNKRERDRINRVINTCKKDIEKELNKSVPHGFEAAVLKVTEWNPYDQNAISPFLDIEWMFGVSGGYDIVIGNPPYLRIQGIRKSDSDFADYLSANYKAATGSFDLYMCFVERSLKFISEKGLVNFIMPVKWTNGAAGKGLRKLTSEGHTISRIINFGAYQVFNASTYTALQWFKKGSSNLLYNELHQDLPSNEELAHYLERLDSNSFSIIPATKLTESTWTLAQDDDNEILKALKRQPRTLGDVFDKIFQGLATGKDGVFFLHKCKDYGSTISAYSYMLGKYVEIEKGITKPLLKGEDVHKYDDICSTRRVLLPYNADFQLMEERLLKSQYPKAYLYLKQFEDLLKEREHGRFDIDGQWYQLSRKQGLSSAECEKLVAPEISFGGNYAYDEDGLFYSSTTVYGYIKKANVRVSYKSLLAILNSSVMWYFIKCTGNVMRGGFYRFKTNYVKPFPMPSDSAILAVEPKLLPIVDKILAAKKLNANANISKEEREIDNIVFDLYGLTKEEREAIGYIDFHNNNDNEPDDDE